MDLASKRVMVTGAGGFLGSHVVARLREGGCTKLITPAHSEFDLTKGDVIETLFRDTQPEVLIHLAAAVGGIGANQRNPGRFFYENAIMGIQLIEAARLHGTQKSVIVGTICSYPAAVPVPFREDDIWDGYPEEVTAPYGIAKKALLVQCQAYRSQYGMDAIFLLPVNLYGPGDHFDLQNAHVVPALVRKCVEARAANQDEVALWGDGTASREFLYVSDAAEGIVQATEHYSKPQPVNLGTGIEVPIRELAQSIARVTGFEGKFVWDATKPNGQQRRCLDVSRAIKEFGFHAKTSLEDGLRRTVEWFLANQSRVSVQESR
ncbi:MAG: GDP-L-fucose synthase [Bryobacteraceae bacterium]